MVLVTLMSFTKAADYWTDPGVCEKLQKDSGIPEFLLKDEGIWKPDHGKLTVFL